MLIIIVISNMKNIKTNGLDNIMVCFYLTGTYEIPILTFQLLTIIPICYVLSHILKLNYLLLNAIVNDLYF